MNTAEVSLKEKVIQIEDTGIKVYKTSDYSLFKTISGNRPINYKHMTRLLSVINKKGMLCNPILVNEHYEVIDGQHRLEACQKANEPVYFIVLKGYGLDEVHTLNLNQKNWTRENYMEGYALLGLVPYIKLKEFRTTNPDFTFADSIAMCSNISSGSNKWCNPLNETGNVKSGESFDEGTWIGKDFDVAQDWANKIRRIKPFFANYNKSVFVGTMLVLFQNDKFDFEEFLRKLQLQPKSLVDCANRVQCKSMIEEIYNFKRREKVNLRY